MLLILTHIDIQFHNSFKLPALLPGQSSRSSGIFVRLSYLQSNVFARSSMSLHLFKQFFWSLQKRYHRTLIGDILLFNCIPIIFRLFSINQSFKIDLNLATSTIVFIYLVVSFRMLTFKLPGFCAGLTKRLIYRIHPSVLIRHFFSLFFRKRILKIGFSGDSILFVSLKSFFWHLSSQYILFSNYHNTTFQVYQIVLFSCAEKIFR